ncbi:MAG: NADP-dependent isocitrate dehydrogenase [Gammaproteobacteria bacterium]|nr:NADP-dependent isocitrate dehydrogenase [Gammaproteobacteria bacterium]
MAENEDTIIQELLDAQGAPVELNGYYKPDPEFAIPAMRPSGTLNDILASL